MPLPRELQLIVDDISNQREHLLEWEVFGNATEDMRVVLTWRHLKGDVKAKASLSRRDSMGLWRLRQTSIDADADSPGKVSPVPPADINKDSKKDGSGKSTDETDSKLGRRLSAVSNNDDSNNDSGRSSPMDPSKASKKKNPFRKLKKDEKIASKGKLKLALSMDQDENSSKDDSANVTEEETPVVMRRRGSKSLLTGSKRNSLLDEKIIEHADEDEESKKADQLKNQNKSKGNKLDKDELSKRLQDEAKVQQENESKNKRKPQEDDQEYSKRSATSGNQGNEEDDSNENKNGSSKGKKISQLEDEASIKRKRGNNEDQEWSQRKNKGENNDKNDESEGGEGKDGPSKGKNIAQLEDETSGNKRRSGGYDDDQEWSQKKNEGNGDKNADGGTEGQANKGKNIAQLEDDTSGKRRRSGHEDDQEWSRRNNENRESNDQDSMDGSQKENDGGNDENGNKRRSKQEEDQEYNKRKNSSAKDEGSSKKKGNPFSKKKGLKSMKHEKDEQTRKDLLEKSRKEVEELQQIGENEESAEFKQAKSEAGAQKMLEMQRQKFKMSIDEGMSLDLDAAKNETVDEKFREINQSDELKNFDKNANELDEQSRESNMNEKNTVEDQMNKRNTLKKTKKVKEASREKGSSDTKSKHEIILRDLPSMDEIKRSSEMLGKTGWEKCADCRYNGFCDNTTHKREYMLILLADAKYNEFDKEDCSCNVCNGGAVHNGCIFRELLRLKTEYRIFDKRNLCFCKTCIPFKYRKLCLRQELRLMKLEGKDIYYRLTFDGEDGDEGYHPPSLDSDDSNYHSDEEHNDDVINALYIDDIGLELTKEDKIDFRNCIDCQFNGFCDNIRHKKLYLMLLRIDDEDFEDLESECGCLVCEFHGSAHSGCADRETKRLKYDLLLFDIRNLCYCRECVPFKYRNRCLRQEMKMLRREKGVNLYSNL